MVVGNAAEHPLGQDVLATEESGIAAYAGVPICLPDGTTVGTFCALDTEPRQWCENDIDVLRDLSAVATELVRSQARLSAEAAANEQIAESRRRLKLILDSTSEGIYGIDSRGVCTFANRKCVELLGYEDTSELLDMNMHQLIHHSHADGTHFPIEECKINRAIERNHGVHADDEVYWMKDGSPIPIEYRSYPVVDGGPTRAVVTFLDISERLRTRSQLQDALDSAVSANHQKTRFLANMSHEIRTPMNAILGFGELLDETVTAPKAREYIKAIRSSGQSLLNLINDILDLSKIESGKLELRPCPISIRGLVESVRLLFAQQAAERNLELTVEVDEGCPDFLELDDLRVRQLLLNLVSNSLKFTNSGSVSVNVSADKPPLDARKVTLIMSVADTGAGIPSEQQKKIFYPFRQVDGADAAGGTGLGLSICKRLVKLMGGSISLESKLGVGSTFSISLPGTAVAAGSSEPPPSADVANFDLLRASRILVVDDNQFNRELAAGYLEDSHHTVEAASDGLEGLEKVRDWHPDVVLMDIRMPVMDGKEARRRIKADPQLKRIPVLAVTASSLLHHTEELRTEFDGYMRKPFSRTQLFRALADVLPPFEEALVEEALAAGEEPDIVEPQGQRDWGELLETLLIWEGQRVAPLLESMVIGDICSFAMELENAGRDARCQPVVTFATTLREQADLFELSKLEVTLKSFGELVRQLQ